MVTELQKTVVDSVDIQSDILFRLAFRAESTLLDIDRVLSVPLDYLDSIA